jgi:hypothetical protein
MAPLRSRACDLGISIARVATTIISPWSRNAARSINPATSSFRAQTVPASSAGGDASRGITGMDDHRSHQTRRVRSLRQANGKMFAVGKMQRDVAAIVDVGALKLRRIQHRAKNLFRDRARDRRHWRNEMIGGKWRHRFMHAARDRALQ